MTHVDEKLRSQIIDAIAFVAESVMSRNQAAAVCQAILPFVEERLAKVESSRRDWAAEAMRLDMELDAAAGAEATAVMKLSEAVGLLEQLADPSPCDHFDHHGACQTHGSDPGQCTHEAAKRFLAGFSRPVCAVHGEEK